MCCFIFPPPIVHSCLTCELACTGGGIKSQEELIQLLHDCLPSAKGLLASAAEQLQGAPGEDPDHPHISANGIPSSDTQEQRTVLDVINVKSGAAAFERRHRVV